MAKPSKRPHRLARQKYTSRDQAKILATLAENENNVYRAARQSGLPESIFREMVKRQKSVQASLKTYSRDHHLKLLEDRAVRTLEKLDPDWPQGAFHLSYAHKNLFADLNLMQGKPTEITAHLHAHRHEIHDLGRKLATALELIDRAQGKPDGEPS